MSFIGDFTLHICICQGRSLAIQRVGSLCTNSGPSLNMHALADWIAKLVQILYCIMINMCEICSASIAIDQADCSNRPFCTF